MSVLTDDDYRALIEQASLLQGLSEHPGWSVLEDFWFHQTKGQKIAVLNGNVDGFDRYKKLTGELVGIQKVLDTRLVVQAMVDGETERRSVVESE